MYISVWSYEPVSVLHEKRATLARKIQQETNYYKLKIVSKQAICRYLCHGDKLCAALIWCEMKQSDVGPE